MNERLCNAQAVAEYVGVSKHTILFWARQGRIPSIPITNQVRRFSLADVLAALKKLARKGRGSGSEEIVKEALVRRPTAK